jgi:hypothetical protein
LSSNSELAQAGPRPSALHVHGVVGRLPPKIDEQPGRVGDHHPIAEQLRRELQVRRLAAAGARAGELEQRLQELRSP